MEMKFFGVYPALLTPFDEKENVDEKRLRKIIKFLISKGVDGLYICGGTGEGMLMNVDERKKVAEIVKEEVGNKVKIITHIGGALNTKNTIELAKHSEQLKIDALSSIPPFYYKFSFKEIYKYYKEVAENTSLPFFIYYIPVTTGVSITIDEICELSKIKNIIGIKYTNYDFFTLQNIILKTRWISFSGPDEMFLPALTMGVVGCIGSTQNVLPEIFIDIYKSFKEGNIKKAMEGQKRITIAVSILKKYDGITAWKATMKFRKIDVGYAKKPFENFLEKNKEKELKNEWKKYFPEFSEGIK
ncbi:MAG TPA: dihydrodipicolinate synthase family protein [Candidatus Ratteibacteria bacterium]|nr:dihydrodipicolinate synthase family protein [Candidatus Ratteibacteria bacterium]